MVGGFSTCQGILIYDTSLKENNALYGFYEKGSIQIIEGKYKELRKIQEKENQLYKNQNHLEDKILYTLVLLMVFLISVSFCLFSLKTFIGFLFFCICGFFPILVLCYANTNLYNNCQKYHQFRKYHACEHALIYCLVHKKEKNLEELKKAPIYDNECGTVYSGILLFLIISISYMIIMDFHLLSILKVMAIIITLLFFNLFNPYNPFRIFQYRAVEKPTDKEYLLAFELMKKYKK